LADAHFAAWADYYVIVGSSGAALIGIQFVVITLIAGIRQQAKPEAIGAFATPTVVHFASALLVSLIMTAPWPSLPPAALALGACGLAGLGYGAIVFRRARRQDDYRPVWEDWLWYAVLPCAAYASLALASLALARSFRTASFGVAAAAVGLLLIGIHNAWDSVTHLVVSAARDGSGSPTE
jgi:ABC-type transporter Mla maintaining outer membrane lipid asymmetry permease subunit MlaE